MLLFLLTLSYSGWSAICLSRARYQALVFASPPSPTALLATRLLGCSLLVTVVLLAWRYWGVGEGLVAAVIAAGVSGTGLIFLLGLAPRLATQLTLWLPLTALALQGLV